MHVGALKEYAIRHEILLLNDVVDVKGSSAAFYHILAVLCKFIYSASSELLWLKD